MRLILKFCLLAMFTCRLAHANIDIPVTSGTSPTCVGRLYSTILIPSQWGSDNGAATRFVQSPEGTLGVTLFFEIGPYGDPASYSSTGTAAMIGVGETHINRFRNNDKVANVNNHGEVAKGGIIAVIKESQAWHHETYHGEGTLLESQRNRFYSVLNGSPNSLDCGGLINSWLIAQNIISQYYGTGNPPAQTIEVTKRPAYLSLYYGSSGFDNVTLPGVSTVNQIYVQSVGSWEVPKYPSGSYLENFFTLTNAQSSSQLYPLI